MKNFKPTERSLTLYYLYCMNFECNNSIYNGNLEIAIPLTAKNLVANQLCKCCGMPLIAAIDVEIKNVVTQINTKAIVNTGYLNN